MAYGAKGRTKEFPVFDCDSHIYEPPEIWDKYIPQQNRDFAKTHFYRDADRLFLVRNGRISFRDPDKWKYPGETWHPGLTKKIIGASRGSVTCQKRSRRCRLRRWRSSVRRSREPKIGMKKSAETGAPEIHMRV